MIKKKGKLKTYLVNHIGASLIKKDNNYVVYSFLCDFDFASEFNAFAELLGINVKNIEETSKIVGQVQARLKSYTLTKFLLIMDNIEKYEDLIKDVVAKISLATNVKFIITTRSPNLIEGINSIHVGLFSQS